MFIWLDLFLIYYIKVEIIYMAMISIKIDENNKKEFGKLRDYLGLPITTAINMFIKQSIREQKLSLNLNTNQFYSTSNIKYLEKKLNEYK